MFIHNTLDEQMMLSCGCNHSSTCNCVIEKKHIPSAAIDFDGAVVLSPELVAAFPIPPTVSSPKSSDELSSSFSSSEI